MGKLHGFPTGKTVGKKWENIQFPPRKTQKSTNMNSIPFTKEQPPGENFFLVTVSIDTPSNPCWNEGFSIFGPWNSVMATLHTWLAANPDKLDHVVAELYQGETAREKRLAILETEIRYQNEKRSQPNN